LPYEDCCTVFLPKAPKTKPDMEASAKQEARLDLDQLIQVAVEGTEVMDLTPETETDAFPYF